MSNHTAKTESRKAIKIAFSHLPDGVTESERLWIDADTLHERGAYETAARLAFKSIIAAGVPKSHPDRVAVFGIVRALRGADAGANLSGWSQAPVNYATL